MRPLSWRRVTQPGCPSYRCSTTGAWLPHPSLLLYHTSPSGEAWEDARPSTSGTGAVDTIHLSAYQRGTVQLWDTASMADHASAAEVAHAWVILQQTAQLLQAAVDARLRAHGLNWQRAAVLVVLRTHGPQPVTALARFVLLHTQSMTDVIDRLEQAGLVQRTRHPTDRRQVLVALTAAGQDAAVAADAAMTEVSATVFGAVSLRDLTQIAALLPRVRDAVAPVAGIPPAHYTYATDTLALRGTPAA
jgi:DNA-binding MarR family transcriptional regulator